MFERPDLEPPPNADWRGSFAGSPFADLREDTLDHEALTLDGDDLVTLILTSLPLSLVFLVMLRHAARLRPTMVAITGSLSVAAITATGLSVFHNLDATVMILIWNLGTSVLIIALACTLGPKMFSWVSKRLILDRA